MNPRPLAPAPPPQASTSVDPSLQPQAGPSSATPSTPSPAPASTSTAALPKAKKPRRSKVAEACRFCRRSHMSCDAGRPCGRCVKRDIAHLCRDEPATAGGTPGPPAAPSSPQVVALTPVSVGGGSTTPLVGNLQLGMEIGNLHSPAGLATPRALGLVGGLHGMSMQPPQPPQSIYASGGTGPYSPQLPMLTTNFNLAMLDLASGQDGMGAGLGLDMQMDPISAGGEGEFHGLGLSEFLKSLNDTPFPHTYTASPLLSTLPAPTHNNDPLSALIDSHALSNGNALASGSGAGGEGGALLGRRDTGPSAGGPSVPGSPINKTERFLLTAADQKDGSRSDRLARVIHAKFEAGLLRPYNHVAGYTRLMRWMADNMSPSSRQRTLHTLSEFRPAFRAIASGLTDLDLVFIEEAFERLLLDYDRVFSSMGIPSCLWRRTGEIYKGNKEFAELVGVPIEHLQGGKLAIYELMAEESAVNYWEKYGNIAFDAGQKAVLTSCVLVNQAVLSRKRKKAGGDKVKIRPDAMINCCFSFTIRRDSYAIPSMCVGNFLPV